MIFYHIQAHENFEYCLHLLSMIYSPDNYYYVSVDTASRADLTPLIDAAARLDNIQIDRTRSVTWGGASLLNTTIVGLRCFVDGPARYSWFVNISGADVPLAAQSDIMSRLAALSKQGVEACLSFEPPDDMSRVRYHTQQMAPGEAPHVWRSWSGVTFVIDRRIAPVFEAGEFPYFDRYGVFAFDDTPDKRIIVRPLLESEALARKALFKRRPFRRGRAWHCISRNWARALFAHPDFAAVVSCMSSLLLSDESFFQTMAADHGDVAEDPRISCDNLRFRLGEPVHITDAIHDELFSTQNLFARKINLNHAPRILGRCTAMCRREIDDFRNRLAAPRTWPVPPPAEERRAVPPAPFTLEPGKVYPFREDAEGNAALEAGWGAPEPGHVWSIADRARIAVRVPEHALAGASAIRCVFVVGAHIGIWVTMQRVAIVANGRPVYSGIMLESAMREIAFEVPRAAIPSNGTIVLEFHLPNAAPVRTVDMKEVDGRLLAMMLYSVTLWRVQGAG